MNSSGKWIEAGYELFAQEGRDGIMVEKLARSLDRNKSGFYHYFGDPETFLTDLMSYHFHVAEQFSREIYLLHRFNPDYFKLVTLYRNLTLAQVQIHRNLRFPPFKETYLKVRKKTERAILPLWMNYVNIRQNPSLALQLWDIMQDLFFVRVSANNFNMEFLQELNEEFVKVIERVRRLDRIAENRIIVLKNT